MIHSSFRRDSCLTVGVKARIESFMTGVIITLPLLMVGGVHLWFIYK